MADVTPGSSTSEHADLQKAGKWIVALAGSLAAAGAALLASGVIPADSQATVWIGIVVTVLGAIGGRAHMSATYTKARSAVKSSASLAPKP